jgi:hypothetical protein
MTNIQDELINRNIGILSASRTGLDADQNHSRNLGLSSFTSKSGFGIYNLQYIESGLWCGVIVIGKASDDRGKMIGFLKKQSLLSEPSCFLFKPSSSTFIGLYMPVVQDGKTIAQKTDFEEEMQLDHLRKYMGLLRGEKNPDQSDEVGVFRAQSFFARTVLRVY